MVVAFSNHFTVARSRCYGISFTETIKVSAIIDRNVSRKKLENKNTSRGYGGKP